MYNFWVIFSDRKLLTDNYNSVTKIHFKNNKGSDGRDPFPKRAFMVKSGFVNDTSPTVPTVGKVCAFLFLA